VAIVKNDPFPGTDYSKFQSWEKVTTPGGQTWYVVPGYPGYVYDPVASNASGRKVFRANPSAAISEHQDEKDAVEAQRKQQAQANSPMGQVTPVIAGTGGILLANEAMKAGVGSPPPTVVHVDVKSGIRFMSDGSQISATGQTIAPAVPARGTSGAAAPTTPSQAAAQGATAPPTTGAPAAPQLVGVTPVTEVGSAAMPDGSPGHLMSDGAIVGNDGAIVQPDGQFIPATPTTGAPAAPQLVGVTPVTEVGSAAMPDGSPGHLMSDGAIVGNDGAIVQPDGQFIPATQSPIVSGLQIAGGAAQAYSGYKQYQDGQKLAGGANIVGGAFNAAAGASVLANGGSATGLSQAAPFVGAGVAAAQVGQNVMNTEGNTDDRAAASQTDGVKAVLPFLGPYGWAAYAALGAVDAVSGGKATKGINSWMKSSNNFNDKIDFGIGKAVHKKIFHQSTRGVQKEHTGQLLQFGTEDPTYQGYVQTVRAQHQEAPPDPEHPFSDTKGNKYRTWDDYKSGGLDAGNLTHVYGNIRVYGPQWASLSEEQRRAVTQANIDSNLYDSHKGEVQISDDEKAKVNFDNVMKGFEVGAQSTAPVTGVPRTPAVPLTPAQAAAQGANIPPRSRTSSPGVYLPGMRR